MSEMRFLRVVGSSVSNKRSFASMPHRSGCSAAWTCPHSCSRQWQPAAARPFALAALHGAHLTHLLQITTQLVDAAADVTAVALQLALTRSARADAAAETAHRLAHTRQTRQNVLVLRQLDLQLALAGARTLCENIEDERRAVEYRAAGQLLQIGSSATATARCRTGSDLRRSSRQAA